MGFPTNFTNAIDGPPGFGTKAIAAHINNLEKKVGIDFDPNVASLDYMARNAYGWGNWASNFGVIAGTICQGNDTRLADSRTPLAHQLDGVLHTVSGLTAGHFLKVLTATTFGFAAHGLSYGDVGALASGGTAVDSDKLDGQHGAYYATASGYVPYTGATGDVTIGAHGLSAKTLTSTDLVTGRIPITSTGGLLTDVSTLLYDSSLNQMIINKNAVAGPASLANTALSIRGTDNTPVRMVMDSYGVAGLSGFASSFARGTAASPSAVKTGDTIMSFEGWGYGLNQYSVSPRVMIRGYASQDWDNSKQATYLSFWTSTVDTIIPQQQWSILATGALVSGTAGAGTQAILTAGTLGAGVSTFAGNNGNAAFTLLNLNNNFTPLTGQTGQTSDLVFNLTQSINTVVSLHEAAKISAYKVNDWFHATTEADTDSGLEFWTTNNGTPTSQLTISNTGLATFIGSATVNGEVRTSEISVWPDAVGVADDGSVSIFAQGSLNSLTLSSNDAGTSDIYSVEQLYFRCADNDFTFMHNNYTGAYFRINVAGTNPLLTSSTGIFDFDNDNIITTGTISGGAITGTSLIATNLTDGYVPYHVSDALGLANSIIQANTATVGIGVAPVDYIRLYVESLTIGSTGPGTGLYAKEPIRAVAVNETNYFTTLEIGANAYNIGTGITDSGYRFGLEIAAAAYEGNFKGTLSDQRGIRILHGILHSNASAIITNSYGLYIDSYTTDGTVSNLYAIYQASSGASNYFAGNILTLGTLGAGAITGTSLALGAGNLTMTGSIADTTNRVTKGWFTNLEITNAPTINGAAWTTILQPLHASLTSIAGLTETLGGIPYGTSDNAYAWLAAGATGKVLIAKGAAAPEWTPYTFPATVPTVGKVLISDGTNLIGSTALGTAAYAATGDFQVASATLTSLAGLTETLGGIPYGTGDNAYAWLAAGGSGKLLMGAGAAAPVWTTPTFPNAATTTGAYLRADGTNFIQSTLILPNAGTAYKLAAYTTTNTLTELVAVGATGEYLAGATGAIPAWATLNQAAVAGLTTASSPTFVTVKLSGLTDGYIPYHVADATGLVNSPIYTDGTNVGIGMSPVAQLDVKGQGSLGHIRLQHLTQTGYDRLILYSSVDDNFGLYHFDAGYGSATYNGKSFFYQVQGGVDYGYMMTFDKGNVGIGPVATAPLSTLCLDGGLHVGGMSAAGDNNLLVDGTATITGGFGCNSKTAQTAYATTAWDEPGAGAFGVDSAAHMATLVALVKAMQVALIANGICS